MSELFFAAFTPMFGAVARIFLIIVFAAVLVRKKYITQDQVKSLSKITVSLLLPCMLFAKISQSFHPDLTPFWWAIPLSSMGMIGIGLVFGYLFYLRTYHQKQFLLPLASMQNAVYLVLPIGKFMYPDQFDQFALYNFLFLIGFMPVVWSIGKILITGSSFKVVNWKEFLTPPLITAMATLLLVMVNGQRFIPKMVLESIDLIGEATIPVSNIVLGATIGSVSLKVLPRFSDVLRLMSIKFILIPIVVIAIIFFTKLHISNPLLANLLIIESAAAPATALVLQIRAYGGDKQTVGSLMIIAYLICLLAIPFWVGIGQLL
jgi:predicted permease